MVQPTATPISGRVFAGPVEQPRTTTMRIAVSTNSKPHDTGHAPAGSVTPKVPCRGNAAASRPLARNAPATCDAMYGSTSRHCCTPATASDSVTAGFMCDPDTGPRA